jgi:hypothetical protein
LIGAVVKTRLSVLTLYNSFHKIRVQAADEARDIFRDELMWYFTEYRQRLDEPKGDK